MLAYHFVGNTLRDGRPIPPDGEWLVHEGPLVMCEAGLHASRKAFDALRYAPGATLCLVEVEDYIEGSDKLVARRRKIIARRDATAMLREFARAQARSVLHLWDAPQVVREYLETGNENLRAAVQDAALKATRNVERDAAWDAAWDAALDAARDAAWSAAWAAARNAAWAAARNAALDAARDAACAVARAKVDDATWDVTWDVVWTAVHEDFAQRVNVLFAVPSEAANK